MRRVWKFRCLANTRHGNQCLELEVAYQYEARRRRVTVICIVRAMMEFCRGVSFDASGFFCVGFCENHEKSQEHVKTHEIE